jgi:hypothetical protein
MDILRDVKAGIKTHTFKGDKIIASDARFHQAWETLQRAQGRLLEAAHTPYDCFHYDNCLDAVVSAVDQLRMINK